VRGHNTPDESSEPRRLSLSDIEALLTREIRSAFESAAQDETLWEEAKRNTREFLRSRNIEIPAGVTVTFLEVEHEGDQLRYLGAAEMPMLEMYCPPTKVWWHECRKIARVCNIQTTIDFNGELQTVERDCHFVCEEFIWDPELTLTKRPPWPPIPLP
jgi:hypothetical protein